MSAVRHTIPGILVTIDKTTTEIHEIGRIISNIITESSEFRLVLPEIMARVDNINSQIPDILERVEHINQNVPNLVNEIEAVRKDMPSIFDRADNLILAAHNLSKKAGEEAVKGAIKGTVGLPFNTTKTILTTPTRILKGMNNTNEKSNAIKED